MNSYLQRLKEKSGKTPTLGTDKTDRSPFVSSVGTDGSRFSENSREVITYRTTGATCDLRVIAGRVLSFEVEVRRRGLIFFRLRGLDGALLPGRSVEDARPRETREECLARLRCEFRGRLALDDDDEAGGHERGGKISTSVH